ncbi:hypothetical protein BVX93_01340, partial [bacterium B13(2017)]
TQTGQLDEIINRIITPISQSSIQVIHEKLVPLNPFPFPWPLFKFLDVFPESVLLEPIPLQPFNFNVEEDYDLIIIGYTAWYLSPSLPITAFLKSETAKNILKNKPVITLIACRNMWLMAQEKVKRILQNLNANLIDNIVLTDQSPPFASFITTPRWMFTGKKDPFLGIFPKAGISKNDITNSIRFGERIAITKEYNKSILKGLNPAVVNTDYIASEKIGNRVFNIWAKFLKKMGPPGKRNIGLFLFLIYLVTIIVTIVPITLIIKKIFKPFLIKKLLKEKAYFELPSGSN